jgi:hypothetical protein
MDTISLILTKDSAPHSSFLTEVPIYLTEVYNNGVPISVYGKETINGKLKDFQVSINEDRVIIKNASLQKFYNNHSLNYFGRSQIQKAFELLSDTIHLPIQRAEVPSFHFAINTKLNYKPELYLKYLGNKSGYKRNEQSHGINYKIINREFSIYDKIREMKDHRVNIPDLYQNSHYIRFETRYQRQVNKHFNIAKITPEVLYSEDFYIKLCNELHDNYKSIDKLKQFKIDMQNITKVKEMQNLGVLALIEAQGGKLMALENITERYKKNELTKKQCYDFRKLINESSKMKLQTIDSDLILELDMAVKENLKFYR